MKCVECTSYEEAIAIAAKLNQSYRIQATVEDRRGGGRFRDVSLIATTAYTMPVKTPSGWVVPIGSSKPREALLNAKEKGVVKDVGIDGNAPIKA